MPVAATMTGNGRVVSSAPALPLMCSVQAQRQGTADNASGELNRLLEQTN
jgi:hypothetical protein